MEIPRRLRRFYKDRNVEKNFRQNEKQIKEENLRMPTINYEDLQAIDKKNFNELRMIEAKNLEEKLALLEIERFKKEKNRMPNRDEAEQIAENIFAQLKDANFYEEKEPPIPSNAPRRMNRLRRREQQKEEMQEKKTEQQETPKASPIINVNDLLKDEAIGEENEKDEFSLDLDLEEETPKGENKSENEQELEELEDLGEENCPNCKKPTEKIIYCPKCGKAFCKECGKKDSEGKVTCPKCGEKFKA